MRREMGFQRSKETVQFFAAGHATTARELRGYEWKDMERVPAFYGRVIRTEGVSF